MAGKYKLVRTPNPKKDGEVLPYHARFVSEGTVSIDDVIWEMESRSSFSSADIKGMMELLQRVVGDYLYSGRNVELEGIGTFSVSVSCRPVMDKKEIRAESVRFSGINYRASVKLRKKLRSMPVSRVYEDEEKKSFTADECRARVERYLQRRQYITRNRYMELNHCSRSKACSDLKLLVEEGLLRHHGGGPYSFYMLSGV